MPIETPREGEELMPEELAPVEIEGAVEETGGEVPPTEDGPEEETVVVSFGDKKPQEEDDTRAPDWVREVRKTNRELSRRLRERDEELTRLKGSVQAEAAISVGTEPTMESVDFDADRFAVEYKAWMVRKSAVDAQQRDKQTAEEKAQQEWHAKLQRYEAGKAKVKVTDFEEAEETVKDTLSTIQQAIILDAAEDSPLLVYALGKSPQKLREITAITNPVKFAAAIGKLETQMKVQPKKTAPVPERAIRSSAAVAGAVDSQLERLRAEAEKSGDSTEVLRYKAQLRAKKTAA